MTRLLTPLAVMLSLGACDATSDDAQTTPGCEGGKCDATNTEDSRNVCVAMRGNGERIFALITGVARVIENYGLLQGAAGGSSASITAFFVESVHENPLVHECGEEACSPQQSAARAALLLKATQGYFQVLANSDEVLAFQALAPLAKRFKDAGISGLAESDPAAAQAALEDVLSSQDLRDLINDEVLETVRNSPNPAFHVRDFSDTASSFGSFEVKDASILLRPGFVDFEKTAEKLGRIGSFLAAWEPVDRAAMAAFLDACAESGRGLNWPEVAALPAGDSTCGQALTTMVESYRKAVTAPDADFDSRIDVELGQGFHAIVATSVITGDAVRTWNAAREAYRSAKEWTFDIDFDDVRLGYFGNPIDLATIKSNPRGYDDAKTRKFLGLGQVTWREALHFSPAEPGLARALEIDAEHVSAGGWPDLHPVLALKNVGCDEVVYVTRQGAESEFATGIASLALDASKEDVDALYNLNQDSGFSLSLQEADAVLCTDWNAFSGLDLPVITKQAWSEAPFLTDDPFFTKGATPDRLIASPAQGAVGCAIAPKSGG